MPDIDINTVIAGLAVIISAGNWLWTKRQNEKKAIRNLEDKIIEIDKRLAVVEDRTTPRLSLTVIDQETLLAKLLPQKEYEVSPPVQDTKK